MKLPFKGTYKQTQGFGENPQSYAQFGYKGHNGLDHGVPNGTDLYAMISGTVIEAQMDSTGYGNYVKIENDKEGALVGHMQSLAVKPGDTVMEGVTLIGKSDNTGNSTGPHTHTGYFPKPRNRNNGYGGYVDFTNMLKGEPTMEISIKDFERIRSNSEKWDKTCQYLGVTTDPATTPFEDIQRVIAGIRSRATDMEKQAATWEAECKNREEQVGRLKDQILKTEALYKDVSDELNKTITNYKTTEGLYVARQKELQKQVDDLSKEKGELNQQIANLETKKDYVTIAKAQLLGKSYELIQYK